MLSSLCPLVLHILMLFPELLVCRQNSLEALGALGNLRLALLHVVVRVVNHRLFNSVTSDIKPTFGTAAAPAFNVFTANASPYFCDKSSRPSMVNLP